MVPLKSQPVASEFRIRVRKYGSLIKYTNETTYLVLQPPSPPFPNTIGSSGALSQLISGSGGSRDRCTIEQWEEKERMKREGIR
jgi:hypothetical protein